jgi:hypothetical protein
MPFERARTLLALGSAQRRAKRKRAARQTLGEALGAFERLGAAIWAGGARAPFRQPGWLTAKPRDLTVSEVHTSA